MARSQQEVESWTLLVASELLCRAVQLLCAAKDETSVEFIGKMFCCNFLRKSRL
jgi:hypothetical protein